MLVDIDRILEKRRDPDVIVVSHNSNNNFSFVIPLK